MKNTKNFITAAAVSAAGLLAFFAPQAEAAGQACVYNRPGYSWTNIKVRIVSGNYKSHWTKGYSVSYAKCVDLPSWNGTYAVEVRPDVAWEDIVRCPFVRIRHSGKDWYSGGGTAFFGVKCKRGAGSAERAYRF